LKRCKVFAVLPYGCQFLTLRKVNIEMRNIKSAPYFVHGYFSYIVFTEQQFANEWIR